ncbi:MAG TPA: peptide-methionine (R)-S-oxide reductase MsrB [Fimbriimonadaceae bacterium]|nr:peptide-methionine (R)-S-oxide reductase MsrB [Fimbriimonadaceae bacterium]
MRWIPLSVLALVGLTGCVAMPAQDLKIAGVANSSPKRKDKVVLSDAEWKKRLTPEQYKILRGSGTEPAFCGVNLHIKEEGTYSCVGCGNPVFKTSSKFDSGTGWPSFYQPFSAASIWIEKDTSYGMIRTSVNCAKCDGHLGHVFDDGPKPTGLRYCINGTVLTFKKK